MNTVRMAAGLRDRGANLLFIASPGSAAAAKASAEGLKVLLFQRSSFIKLLCDAWVLAKLLRRRGPQILISVYNPDLPLVGWLRRFGKGKIRLVYQQHMQLTIKKRDPVHTFRYSAIDAWVAPLPYLKQQVITNTRFPENRVHVIPIGLDLSALKPPPGRYNTETRIAALPASANMQQLKDADKLAARKRLGLPPLGFIAGILGRIDAQKGQGLCIEAIALLNKAGHNAALLVMGEGTRNEQEAAEYLDKILALPQALGIAGKVYFKPYQPNPSDFYNAIDVFLLASGAETYGMVTLEAMAAGVPVAGSHSGGTIDLLKGGELGNLYIPGDAAGMANAILDIMLKPAAWQQKAGAARLWVFNNYGLQKMLGEMEKVFAELEGR